MNFKNARWIILFLALALVGATPVFASHHGTRLEDKNESEKKTNNEVERITVDELKAKFDKGETLIIIDVRGQDYDTSDTKIKGALRFSGDLKSATANLPHDKQVVTYCSCGTDGGAVSAALRLREAGFTNVRALKGGWNAWRSANGPVEAK